MGKYFFQVDIRNHGSKNPGATNTLRVMGKKAAIIVLLIDGGKEQESFIIRLPDGKLLKSILLMF